jgi:glutaredoxin
MFLDREALAQNMYKSVDSHGKVIYSNFPPANARVDKTLNFTNLPSSKIPAAPDPKHLRDSPTVKAPIAGVILYQADWCGYCRKAKAYLASKGITYQAIDIDSDYGRDAFAQVGNGQGIPLLFAEGHRVQGFSDAAYDEIFGYK